MKQHHTKYVKELVLLSFLSSILTVGKLVLFHLPNIEVVTFLFILYTITLGVRRTLMISVVFIVVEILFYGIDLWTIGYIFVWPLLILIGSIFKNRIKKPLGWAIISGLFGLSFGLLFAIYTAPLTKVSIFAYWLSGIQFDITHMIGNFTLMLLLYKPVKKVLETQLKEMNI